MELGMIRDHKLRQDVIDELDFEPSLDTSHIAVGVHDGVVTLTGSVSSYADKLAAERAARRVFGVRAIAQEIEIRLPSDKKTGDDEIAKRAADILKWRVGVPADQIVIKVEKGVVTLAGEADWQFQRKQAENAVHNLTGVIGINNLIGVRARPEIPKIKEKIQQALKRSAELDSSQVTVRAEGGKVILGGKVHAWFERDLAEQAAWSAPGVTDVQDHIEIEPWAPVITRGSLQ
jgi:osmotically-inducible protein OsmY